MKVIFGSALAVVADWLRRTPDGDLAIVHRGRDATYVDVRGRCLGVLSRRAVEVPCGIATRLADLAYAGVVGAQAHIDTGRLFLDGVEVRIGRIRSSTAPTVAGPSGLPVDFNLTADVMRVLTPQMRAHGLDPSSVEPLLGAGPGLTPLGDDVLAGWLATHWAAGRPDDALDDAVRHQLHRTTLLSATLLEHAQEGEVIPQFADFLQTVGTDAEPEAAAAVAVVGATSGAGLLTGARLALRALHDERKVA